MPQLMSRTEEIEKYPPGIAVIGSGPAGVAFTERVCADPNAPSVAIFEQGGFISQSHIGNVLPSGRRKVLERFGTRPWEGTLGEGGTLLPALGGRSLVAGLVLPRFHPEDFTLWPDGAWPITPDELAPYYEDAEVKRGVSIESMQGALQTLVHSRLGAFAPRVPPLGMDSRPPGPGQPAPGVDSAAARLHALLLGDCLDRESARRRVRALPNVYVTHILHRGGSVYALRCVDTSGGTPRIVEVRAKSFVLAASPIESTRLVLNSGLGSEAAGRYLAEHIDYRATLKIRLPAGSRRSVPEGVAVLIPPPGARLEERYQIQLKRSVQDTHADDTATLEMVGFAAMDPQRTNAVTLSDRTDEFGIPKAHTRMETSAADREREARMCATMKEIAAALNAEYVKPLARLAPGRSYHEAGTLRMGRSPHECATDALGRLHGWSNVYVADASVFPCVGVVNPMLTVTALAYRAADALGRDLSPANAPRYETAALR